MVFEHSWYFLISNCLTLAHNCRSLFLGEKVCMIDVSGLDHVNAPYGVLVNWFQVDLWSLSEICVEYYPIRGVWFVLVWIV